MKNVICILWLTFMFSAYQLCAQSNFVVKNTGSLGQGVRNESDSTKGNHITDIAPGGYSVAVGQTINSKGELWYQIYIPSSTGDSVRFAKGGQGPYGSGSMMPNCAIYTVYINYYDAYIFTGPSTSDTHVTINGVDAKVWAGQYYAYTGNYTYYSSSDIWYQIYFPKCDGGVSTGWIPGPYLGTTYSTLSSSFNTIALSAPVLSAATNITSSSMDLNWTQNPVNDGGGSTSYDVHYNSSYVNTVDTSKTLSSLTSNTPYSIYIVAKYGSCISSNSNTIRPSTNNSTPSCINPGGTISSSQTVLAGENAVFNVLTVSGTAPVSYTWQVKAKTSNSFYDIYPAETASTLVIRNVSRFTDGNQYRCDFRNSCTPGYAHSDNIATLSVNSSSPESMAIQKVNDQKTCAEPVQVGTGTFRYERNFISMPIVNGDLNFTLFYNSFNHDSDGTIAYGWSHSYNYYFAKRGDSAIDIHYPDGHVAVFIPHNSGYGLYDALYGGTNDSFVLHDVNYYWLITKDKTVYQFDVASGRLFDVIDRNGVTIHLDYSYKYTNHSILSSIQQMPSGRRIDIYYTNIAGANRLLWFKFSSFNLLLNYDNNGNLHNLYDLNNNYTYFNYDSQHQLTSIVHPFGDTILKNYYDVQNRVFLQSDAYNKQTRFSYDSPSIGFTTITYSDGNNEIVRHDSSYRMTYDQDESGYKKYFSYDFNNNPTSLTNENNELEVRNFDYLGQVLYDSLPGKRVYKVPNYNGFEEPLQVNDPLGKKTLMDYDLNGNLDTVSFPDKSERAFTYNSDGTLNAYLDGKNNLTQLNYYATGDIESITRPNGTRHFNYDTNGRPILVYDEKNNRDSIVYDNNGNIIAVYNALNYSSQFNYDGNNNLIGYTDKRNLAYKFNYDKKERLTSKVYPNLSKDSFRYDVRDRLTFHLNPNGVWDSFSYFPNGKLKSKTNAYGSKTFTYDGVGNLLTATDETGVPLTFNYEHTDKLHLVKDILADSISINHDSADNVISSIDARGSPVQYTYDPLYRIRKVMDVYSDSTVYGYDLNGNFSKLTDGNQHNQFFNYDSSNRLSSYIDGAKNKDSIQHDATGNITKIIRPGDSSTFTYDALNRLTGISLSTGDAYGFQYDSNNNVDSMGNKAGATFFGYNSNNQMRYSKDPYKKTVIYNYDTGGRKIAIIYPGGNTVKYTYDSANRLKTVTDWNHQVFTYSYDAAGRLKLLLYPNGSRCEYQYDGAGRLIARQNFTPNGDTISSSVFTLDANGRRIAEQRYKYISSGLTPASNSYAYANNDALQNDAINAYGNDNSGNRVSKKGTKDSASYIFTADNRLVSITKGGKTTTFQYDAEGHRIQSKIGNVTTNYVLDLSGPLSEVLQMTDSATGATANYIYGLGLLESIDAKDSALLYYFDAQHNTVAIANTSASIKATFTYDPFGAIVAQTGSLHQPFAFLGEYGVQQQDSSSVYYIRARYYDAATGRFLSQDPLRGEVFNPQSLNRYVYGVNNPLSMYDFNGLCVDKSVQNINQSASILAKLSPYFSFIQGVIAFKQITMIINRKALPIESKIGNFSDFRNEYSLLSDEEKNLGFISNFILAPVSAYVNINDWRNGNIGTGLFWYRNASIAVPIIGNFGIRYLLGSAAGDLASGGLGVFFSLFDPLTAYSN